MVSGTLGTRASLCWDRDDAKAQKAGMQRGMVQVVDRNRYHLHVQDYYQQPDTNLYACYATNKCSTQVQQTTQTLYYRILTFARSRASYS